MKVVKHLSKLTLVLIFFSLAFPKESKATYGHYHNWWCWYYGCNYDDDDGGGNDVPLDGGLSFLAIAGAGLGIKKVIDKRKGNKNSEK